MFKRSGSPLGPSSGIVNGQLLDFPTTAAYNPQGYGPQTIAVPQISPSLPPYMAGASPMGVSGNGGSVGGYGTAENNTLATTIAANNPWNARVSPVIWAVGGLVLSLVLLKAIHWRETIVEGNEGGRVGDAREEASASA